MALVKIRNKWGEQIVPEPIPGSFVADQWAQLIADGHLEIVETVEEDTPAKAKPRKRPAKKAATEDAPAVDEA